MTGEPAIDGAPNLFRDCRAGPPLHRSQRGHLIKAKATTQREHLDSTAPSRRSTRHSILVSVTVRDLQTAMTIILVWDLHVAMFLTRSTAFA